MTEARLELEPGHNTLELDAAAKKVQLRDLPLHETGEGGFVLAK